MMPILTSFAILVKVMWGAHITGTAGRIKTEKAVWVWTAGKMILVSIVYMVMKTLYMNIPLLYN